MRALLKNINVFLLLVAMVAFAGCDSNGDDGDGDDAARFLGAWTISSIADQGGQRDQTSIVSDLGVLRLTMNDDQTFGLNLQYLDPEAEDLALAGTYVLNEGSTRLTLNVQLDDLPTIALPFTYMFLNDIQVEFTIDAAAATTLTILLGAPLEGDVVLLANKG